MTVVYNVMFLCKGSVTKSQTDYLIQEKSSFVLIFTVKRQYFFISYVTFISHLSIDVTSV